MTTYFLFLAAVAPPILLAYLVFRLVKFKQLKLEVCLRLFILGGLIVVPTGFAERAIDPILSDFTQSVFLIMLIGVALIEELFKFSVVMFSVYNKDKFDAPIEAIVYVVMVGLGFALAENVMYVFNESSIEEAMGTAIQRMFTAIPMHALCGVFMGYFVGRAQLEKDDQSDLILLGLLSAILLHQTYNYLILEDLLNYAVILLIVACFFAASLISKGQINSGIVLQNDNSDVEPLPEYFSKALDEVKAGLEDEGLKARAYANSLNEEEAEKLYINLRAEALMRGAALETKVEQKKPLEAQNMALVKEIKYLELELEKSRRYRLVLFFILTGTFISPPIPLVTRSVLGLSGFILSYKILSVWSLKNSLKRKQKSIEGINKAISYIDDPSLRSNEKPREVGFLEQFFYFCFALFVLIFVIIWFTP